jgi:hypothetical protein
MLMPHCDIVAGSVQLSKGVWRRKFAMIRDKEGQVLPRCGKIRDAILEAMLPARAGFRYNDRGEHAMATSLKRIDLLLEEELLDRLNQEAEQRQVTPSEVVQSLLSHDLGLAGSAAGATERLRRIREQIGPMPDSAPLIRTFRDRGW